NKIILPCKRESKNRYLQEIFQIFMQGIKNVIFDLGGVILNLDLSRTISEFNKLSAISFEKIYTQANQNELFDLLDKGKISESDFFNDLKKKIDYSGSTENMVKAWNAMLLNVPEKRLDVLVSMK